MRVITSTGGTQDYLELEAESIAEYAQLIQTTQGVFGKMYRTQMSLNGHFLTPTACAVKLRIIFGDTRLDTLDAKTKADIDATA